MKCAKCGLDMPAGVKQCPKCGLINEFEQSEQQEPRKKKTVLYAIIALGLVALVAITFAAVMAGKSKNVTSAPGGALPPSGNVLSASGGKPSGSGVMSAPSGAPAPDGKTPPAANKSKPSQAMLDYLQFVKKVEEHRQMLLRDTTDALTLAGAGGEAQNLLNMIDMATNPDSEQARDPLADAKKELNRQYKNWVSTLQYFDKQPAPSECREFSGAYRGVIYNETKAIGEIAVSFNSVNIMESKDMSKLLSSLQKMKGDPSIQESIDKSADDADNKLTKLVSNYGIQKPFDVPREKKTSGNIMGF